MTIEGSFCCGTDAACVFTKAVLAQRAACPLACRQAVGEADLVRCNDPAAQGRCADALAALRQRARFALKLPHPGTPLRHAQALQLQCGGLRAWQAALHPGGPATPPDVNALLAQAGAAWPGWHDAPWPALVAATAAWQPQRRRGATPH